MKKALLIFMTLTTFVLSAQNTNSNKREDFRKSTSEYSPEQRAELRSKQMTLDLNLNTSQQIKVKELLLKTGQNRGNAIIKGPEMTAEEKFNFKNAMLDRRVEMKKELKQILNEDQYQIWEKSIDRKTRRFRKKNFERKGNGQ